MLIDTSFDFRVDARGKDPDSHSPTLRKYHKRLWSRPLPGGVPFELRDTTPGVYLHHRWTDRRRCGRPEFLRIHAAGAWWRWRALP